MGNVCSGEDQAASNANTEVDYTKKNRKSKKSSKSKSTTKSKTTKKSKSSKSKKGEMPIAEPVTGETFESEKTTKGVEEPEYDEGDFKTLLPAEPTLKDAQDDKENLKIMKQARKEAVEMWDLFENHDWTLVKEDGDFSVYKGKTEGTQLSMRRHMVVDAPIDTCIEVIQDHDVQKKINDRIEQLETKAEIGTDSRILYQKMKGTCSPCNPLFRQPLNQR